MADSKYGRVFTASDVEKILEWVGENTNPASAIDFDGILAAMDEEKVSVGMTATAEQLLEQYDAGCQGREDVDMRGILIDIIADIQSSYIDAMLAQGFSAITIKAVTTTVNDYIVNHYGEDN